MNYFGWLGLKVIRNKAAAFMQFTICSKQLSTAWAQNLEKRLSHAQIKIIVLMRKECIQLIYMIYTAGESCWNNGMENFVDRTKSNTIRKVVDRCSWWNIWIIWAWGWFFSWIYSSLSINDLSLIVYSIGQKSMGTLMLTSTPDVFAKTFSEELFWVQMFFWFRLISYTKGEKERGWEVLFRIKIRWGKKFCVERKQQKRG